MTREDFDRGVVGRFLQRLGHCPLPLIRSIDIFLCTVWLSLLYPFALADRPTGRQTISGYVGKAAHNGHRWGARSARFIDWLFLKLGDAPEHCARAYVFYLGVDVVTD